MFRLSLSHLQALKEQIQGNPKMHYKTVITLDLFLEGLKMT